MLVSLLVIGLLAFGAYWQFGRSVPSVLIDYKNAEVVALGKEVYSERCASCHGVDLKGQPNWRTRHADGRLPAPPHDGSGHTWHHSDQQLFELTKYGPSAIVGGSYESEMPAYDGVLSDREILGALAFIKNAWPDEIRERHDQINQRARE